MIPRLTIICLAAFILAAVDRATQAQEPANQDKLGQGATGKQTPLAPATRPKAAPTNSSPTAAPVDGKKPSDAAADAPASGKSAGAGDKPEKSEKPEKIAYDYELPGPDGKAVAVSTFKGKTLLIVNLAHDSTSAAQLAALEKLSGLYKAQGLVVIGVPSNDFGAAEPGTDADLQKLYKTTDKIDFPVMAKSSIIGVHELPFYTWITAAKAIPKNGPVHWNFTKFIVGKDGKALARFAPDVAPDSPELLSTLDQIFAGTYKPAKSKKPGAGSPDESDDDGDD